MGFLYISWARYAELRDNESGSLGSAADRFERGRGIVPVIYHHGGRHHDAIAAIIPESYGRNDCHFQACRLDIKATFTVIDRPDKIFEASRSPFDIAARRRRRAYPAAAAHCCLESIFFMNKVHPTCALNDLVHYRNWFGCKPHKFHIAYIPTCWSAKMLLASDQYEETQWGTTW